MAQVCALFTPSSSPCFMRVLSDLFDLSIHFISYLFISIFLHLLLPYTFYFLDVVDYNHALPLRSWVHRTRRTSRQLKDTMKNARKSSNCSWNMPCHAKVTLSAERHAALKITTLGEQDTHASSKPTNPRDRALKRLKPRS